MINWNSLIFCWNNSRVGNAMSESSLIGVPSCFSGGRRMVKCTRSTLASDFSRLRQVRSPECGSPETSSTRSLSRTPSIDTTARLLTVVSSRSSGEASISTMLGPACGIAICTSTVWPVVTVRWSSVSPSRLILTWARPAGAPVSSTRNDTVCCWRTMPKRGAATRTTRRSRSSGAPVISACSGAAKPSAPTSAGTSWTRPSVIMKAPATRSGGTSESVAVSAWNSRVPSVSPSACPASTTRSSSPGTRGPRGRGLRRALAEILARALVDHHDRDRGEGIAIFPRQRRIGERRHHQRERERADGGAAGAADEQQNDDRSRDRDRGPQHRVGNQGGKGDTETQHVLLLAEPLEQSRHVDLIGLVVAGERVHHDVDAGAERELALTRLARHQGEHGLAVGSRRPGAGEVVRRDDDR